jgi:hypothetical protein
MANPTSRQGLIDYALRKLGAPVIEINVDDDQLEDRVDEALQFYQEYHSDAILKVYYKHQITSTDVANEYVTLPDAITSVQRILPLSEENSTVNMFDARYQISLNDIFDLGNLGNLSNYAMIQNYMTTLDMMLNGTEHVRFSRHMNRLHIDTDWGSDIKEGQYIIIDAFQIIDPESYNDVYNDMFLKRYVTALVKMQWGSNLSKFEGMQLPGGVTINAQRIMEEAREEITKIEEEMQLKYEMPPMFYMG